MGDFILSYPIPYFFCPLDPVLGLDLCHNIRTGLEARHSDFLFGLESALIWRRQSRRRPLITKDRTLLLSAY